MKGNKNSWRNLLIFIALLPVAYSSTHTQLESCEIPDDQTFPDDFVFGASSSAYQIEGAWNVDKKGPNIWDTAVHSYPEKFPNGNGDDAAKSYYNYMEDVKALNETGLKAYRFSVSWSRVMETGEPSSLNRKGLDYYHRLIDALLDHSITPVITMMHWDLPQPIQDVGGFLNPLFADYFEDYADVLFQEFGDKVKNWITFNEQMCQGCYGTGEMPPFIIAAEQGGEYNCAYHLLLAHARAYHLYNGKYRESQKGSIGIVVSLNFLYPADGIDYFNAERGIFYGAGIFANPIFSKEGGFPEVVISEVNKHSAEEGRTRSRLPEMTKATREFIRGTADWFGLNYYSSYLAEFAGRPFFKTGMEKDKALQTYADSEWETAESDWIHNVPEGLRDALNYIAKNYGNPEIRITENGWSDKGELHDQKRIAYFQGHLKAVLQAINCDHVNVKHYYAWSLLDNFEWLAGYTQRFGLYHVDFSDSKRPRTRKDSAKFFYELTKSRKIPDECFGVRNEL